MRTLLTSLVFLASLAAVVLVHVPRAHAAWRAPQAIDAGHSPKVAYGYPDLSIAYAQGSPFDASRLLGSAGNEPTAACACPRRAA